MNYLEKQYIFYSELLKLLTSNSEKEINAKVAEVCCLGQERTDKLNRLCNNETYKRIKSSEMINIHIAAINTFCKGRGFFGDNEEEAEALESKKKAFEVFEQIDNGGRAETILSENTANPTCLCIYVFLKVLSGFFSSESILRPFVRDGITDAALLYAALYKQTRKETVSELYNSAFLSDEEKDIIGEYYSMGREDIFPIKKFKLGFGAENERNGY